MSFFHRPLFILAHSLGHTGFFPMYKRLMKNQWKPRTELKAEQDKQLQHMIQYCNENVPYYHTLFKNLNIRHESIKTIYDLQKLPVLTKETIKENWNDFKPVTLSSMKYQTRATGGSTGTPLQYRITTHDRFLSGALLYRGWGYGGYELGDKMVFIAGSSLDTGVKSNLVTKTYEFARNLKKLSAFDMGEKEMQEYAKVLNSFKPRFIRGYASSIYFFARWVEEHNVVIASPDAVFTTAEKLYPHMRETIARVFACDVFDGYGLNDGGLSAFECPEHSGLHIDTERSILEIVDGKDIAIEQGEGRILTTSMHNYAMPLLRYNTGDIGTLLDFRCACGRDNMLLQDIMGREKEFLITPHGQYVHGAALFNLIFYTMEKSDFPDIVNKVKEFQVIQKKIDKIEIVFACDDPLPDKVLGFIQSAIQKRFVGWDVEFRYVDKIERTGAAKFKFIINEITNA